MLRAAGCTCLLYFEACRQPNHNNLNLQIQAEKSLRYLAAIVTQLTQGYWNRDLKNSLDHDDESAHDDLRLSVANDFPYLCLEATLKETKESFEMETESLALQVCTLIVKHRLSSCSFLQISSAFCGV